MTFLLDEQTASMAVRVGGAAFQELQGLGTFGERTALWVMVLDPGEVWTPGRKVKEPGVILYEGQYGEPGDKYRHVAMRKAHISWKWGKPSRVVRETMPWAYEKYDTVWGGSYTEGSGLVVSASGVDEYWDEVISKIVWTAIWGFTTKDVRGAVEYAQRSGAPFLGSDQYRREE